MTAIAAVFGSLTYRGREGQIAWLLHRVTGVGIFAFLTLHIVNTFLMAYPAHVFNSVMVVYHSLAFKLLSIFGLYLGVLYHALNGIRVVIVDFWPGAGKYQAPMWRVQMVLFAVAFVPSAAVMVARIL